MVPEQEVAGRFRFEALAPASEKKYHESITVAKPAQLKEALVLAVK
jgi:hypothetical protein